MVETTTEATEEPQTESDESDEIDSLILEVARATERLESFDGEQLADATDVQLVELRTELKELESNLDDLRKNDVDAELNERIAPGESLLGVNRIVSHRKYVEEDAATLIMRAVGQGISYTDFVEVNVSDLAEVAPGLTEIKKHEYTYLR